MENLVQLNLIDGCLTEPQQRAMGIYFACFDLYLKSKGKWDYRGTDGHQRLFQDALNFCGTGNPTVSRHGDLAACHLSLDWNDAQIRLMTARLPLLSTNVNDLIFESRDLSGLTPQEEKRISVLLDYLSKKTPVGC